LFIRTQAKNRNECIQKLEAIVNEALIEPKERSMWTGIGEKTKETRRDEKRKRGEVKSGRRNGKFDFDD